MHRCHAAGGSKGIFSALQRRDTFFEHPRGRVAVAGINKLVIPRFDKPRFGSFGGWIDKTLGQINRFGHLAILAAPAALMHQFGAGFPSIAHAVPCLALWPKKNPGYPKARG